MQGEIGVVREVFNTFFKYYPYCYGYWKKMADFEKTHAGIDTAKQASKVYSVGNNICQLLYCVFVLMVLPESKVTFKRHCVFVCVIQVYERGVEAVAMSTDIWLHYIKFMTSIDADNKEAIRRCGISLSLSLFLSLSPSPLLLY